MIRICLVLLLLTVDTAATADGVRRDAIFILGEDKVGEGTYFEPASVYYEDRLRRDIDLFVRGARSLQDVREWLVRSHRDGDPPWGRIVLVAHGSPWSGLAVPLYTDGTRADLPDLERAIKRGEFPPLPDQDFDAQTQIVLESCGIGRRPELLDLYAKLLGGADVDSRAVVASDHWIEYGLTRRADGKPRTWRNELLFEAKVIPKASLDAEEARSLRELLSEQLAKDSAGAAKAKVETWRTAPVHIALNISDPGTCRSDRAIRQLSNHATITDKLRGYGLHGKDLAWHVEQAAQGCSLIGQGTLGVLGEGSMSGELLP